MGAEPGLRVVRWVFIAWMTHIPAAVVLDVLGASDTWIIAGSTGTGAVVAVALDLWLNRRAKGRERLRRSARRAAARKR